MNLETNKPSTIQILDASGHVVQIITIGNAIPSISFEQFARAWLEQYKKLHPKSTWVKVEERLRLVWFPYLGKKPINQISRAEIQSQLRQLQIDGLSNATVNRYKQVISQVFQEALMADDPRVTANPCHGIKNLSEKTKRRPHGYWKSMSDVETYIAASYQRSPRLGAIAEALLFGGFRVGELLALQWGDIDWETQIITVRRIRDWITGRIESRTKGQRQGGSYELPLFQRLASCLIKWKSQCSNTKDLDLVFPGVSYTMVQKAHRHALKRTRLPRITIHGLRHTYATNLMKAGFQRAEIQEWLGHENLSTTRIYTHVDLCHIVEKARQLGFAATSGLIQH